MSTARWTTENGISDLSEAVDEIYMLRALLADEAGILEAHLGYKTFPKTRRKYAEQQVERMREAAKGNYLDARREKFDPHRALRTVGESGTLTNHQWAQQRGLVPVEPE